jgi:hypothetical protein
MKKCLLIAAICATLLPAILKAQNTPTEKSDSLELAAKQDTSIFKSLFTDEVIVKSTRAEQTAPLPFLK